MAYSTALQVRNILPHLLIDEDIIGEVPAGTYIELNNPVYDVPSITKDGTTLTKDTDFTFTRPYMVTLDTAADGENYIATVYIGAADSKLEDVIARADRRIADKFANYDLPPTTYLQDWSSVLAASYFLRQSGTATEETMERAKALEKQAMDAIEDYLKNSSYGTEEAHPQRRFVLKVNR